MDNQKTKGILRITATAVALLAIPVAYLILFPAEKEIVFPTEEAVGFVAGAPTTMNGVRGLSYYWDDTANEFTAGENFLAGAPTTQNGQRVLLYCWNDTTKEWTACDESAAAAPGGGSTFWASSTVTQMYNLAGYNVGIGTTTPAYQLDVYGNSRIDGILTLNDRLYIEYSGSDRPFEVDASGSSIDGQPAFALTIPDSGQQKVFQMLKGADAMAFASFEYNIGGAGKPGFALGAGGGDSRDTNIYRDSANVLKTDDSFVVGGSLTLGTDLADSEISDTLTVTGYMQDEDINTIAELNSWVSDATLLISGGTLTSGKICRYDGTGIDCDYDDVVGAGGDGLATSTPVLDTWMIYATAWNTVGGESAFTYNDSTDVLTVVNASTTRLTYDTGWFTTLYGGTLSGVTIDDDLNTISNIDGENIKNDTIDNDSIDWGDMTDLTTDGAVTWSNLASGELTSEVLILGTDVKAGTLTDTKICTWDDGNSQIACEYTDVVGAGGSGLATSTNVLDTFMIYATAWNTVGGEAAFTYNDATDVLTVVNASTTGLTATQGWFTTLYGATMSGITIDDDTNTISNIDGENIKDDTIDNDSIDWGDMTDLGTDGVVTWGNLGWTEIDDYPSACGMTGGVVNGIGDTLTCVATSTWDTNTTYTAGDALTLTGTDFDFDGGATPSGDLGGTWGTPTVTWGNLAEGELTDSSIVSADIKNDTIDSDDYAAGSIDAEHIAADTITHTQIADADQADTKCIWFEDPTADDDFNSIWTNKTANDFLITEIWAESDQTVNFDLQIDDGSPADVNGTDLAPAAGEAEDTSLSGDTTLAAGEELDLAITSVSGTPTWVSICWTGNWAD